MYKGGLLGGVWTRIKRKNWRSLTGGESIYDYFIQKENWKFLTVLRLQTFSDFPLHTAHIIYLQELDKYFCMAVYPPLIARLWVTYLDDVLSSHPPKAQERSSKTHFYHTIPWSKSCNGFLLFPSIIPCFVDFSPQMPCLCLPFVHILPLLQILFSIIFPSASPKFYPHFKIHPQDNIRFLCLCVK